MNNDEPPGLEPVKSLWIGERLSVMERLVIRSFLHAGHPFHLYLYDELRDVPTGCTVLDAAKVLPRERIFTYPGLGSYGGFANLFRYKLLSDTGGTWVDMDVVCVKPFRFGAEYVFGQESTGFLGNCVIKSPAGSPLLTACFEQADAVDPKHIHWGQTGPALLTEMVRQFDLWEYALPPSAFCPVHYSQFRTLVEQSAQMLLAPVRGPIHAIHLWHELWRRHGVDKDADYPPDCCYEQLKVLLLDTP